MAVLLAELNAYLERDGADPVHDDVGCRQGIWLTPAERAAMISELREVFLSRWTNSPTPERAPHLMSAIFFPAAEPPRPGPDHDAFEIT